MAPSLSRRRFLTLLGTSVAATHPAFLARSMERLAAAGAPGHPDRILVVLQLAGGNDGLNTLVPRDNDHYRRARPNLGLRATDLLPIDDSTGLHPALRGLHDLHARGRLGILPAVGYPNPNRSHFVAQRVWESARPDGLEANVGWLGRYLDHECTGADPLPAVSVGPYAPAALSGRVRNGAAFRDAAAFERLDPNQRPFRGRGREMTTSGMAPPSDGSTLDWVARVETRADAAAHALEAILERAAAPSGYPNTDVARDLSVIARLIAGGCPSRIYYASHTGYDTHSRQAARQSVRLSELDGAVAAFLSDLAAQGLADRVLLVTFSEFGRRVAENACAGTDHGAAGPCFLIGPSVRPGVFGPLPDLAPESLVAGDIRFLTDFRSFYATLLERWFRVPAGLVLEETWPLLDVLPA